MIGSLIVAIVSTFFEEAVLFVLVFLVLPGWGVKIPAWVLALVFVVWLAFSIFIYHKGTIALQTKQTVGLHNMIGTRGEVVKALGPEGMVRIKGELWKARSDNGELREGTDVVVVGQDRLELIVQKDRTSMPGTRV